jgi:hypothetical protein
VNLSKNIGVIFRKKPFFLGRSLWRFSLLLFLVSLSSAAIAQSDVSIFGVVRDHDDSKKISGVKINILEDNVNYNSVSSNSSGKYEFVIGFDHVYKIIYTYPNYVTKYLTVDTRYVPEDEKAGGYEMNIDMTLFQEIEGLDVSILENPIGKAQFDVNEGRMGWDMDYTRQMQAQLNALMKEHDKKLKEEAERLAKMKADFQELVRKGDDAVRKQNFADAVDLYTDALILFPNDEPVQTKKAEAEKAVAAELANKEKEAEYNAFINSGDSYFGNEDWQNALSSYQSASDIFPSESYPKNRIKEVNEKLDAIKKNAANEAAVAKLIKEGDALVGQDKYDDAISKYTEALALIPGHQLATSQLALAKEKKIKWLAAQESEQNYANLITKADQQFNSNDFRAAIDTYNDALQIKATEKYPKDQIAKAEKILSQAAAETEKKNQFLELVKQGDSKVTATQYKEGIDIYRKALALYPDDTEVKQKISDAQEAMNNKLAAGEKEAQYKALIAKADKALAAKEYESAKSSYNDALGIKANEPYPTQKIAEIDGILAGIQASKEALAQKALQEKFAKIVAQGDEFAIKQNYNDAINKYEEALDVIPNVPEVEDKIADAKKKQQDLMANKALDEQYNEWIAKADHYMSIKKYEEAKDAYLEALLLYDKSYPKEQVAAIDKLLKDLAQQADQDAKLQEFNRLEQEGDEYVSQEAYQDAIKSYGAALAIMDDQGVKEKKAAAEKSLSALNMNAAFAEQYNALIEKADKAFAAKDYGEARSDYQKAFAVMAEDYPKNKIKEIDRILLEQERRNAEEEAAKLASVNTEEEWNSNTSDEERYIKEAEKEQKKMEDSNYEALLAYKAAIKKTNDQYTKNGNELRSENASVIQAEREKNIELFSVGEEKHDENVQKSANQVESYSTWLKDKSDDQQLAGKSTYRELSEQQKDIEREHTYKSDRYKEYAREVQVKKEDYQNFGYTHSQDQARKIRSNYRQSQNLIKEQYKNFEEGNLRKSNMEDVEFEKEDKEVFLKKNQDEQNDRIANYREDADQIRARQQEKDSEHKEEVKESYNELNKENEMRDVEADRWKNRSDIRRDKANDESRSADHLAEKDYEDYVPGELAKNYQQGVTEETYEEGNAKVVKRVVVKGNKADEYKMVVQRSGTYYFKNGSSISKNTWNNETEQKTAYRD